MKQPLVSVIMPVYNGHEYLSQCLESVMNQTLRDIEIICVDDGSADDSVEILKKHAEKDARIKVIEQANGGAGAARNNGLRHATGKYLSFLDSDDFFEPTMLEHAVNQIQKDAADFVVFRCDQYMNDTKKFKKVNYSLKADTLPNYTPFSFRNITDNVFKSFVGWAWDKVYDADFVRRNLLTFQEQRTSNDLLFVFSALVLAKKITWLDEVLAHQRRNNGESLSNTREKSWHCFYDALCALRNTLKEKNLYEELERDFVNYALHFSLWNINTITGPCYELLYNKLQKEWFEDLGIKDKPEEYFYNKDEYFQRREILERSASEYPIKVSVVIPVHNAEKFIAKGIESALKQKVAVEVICVDDCSTDNSPKIMKEYAEKYENVHVLTNETNVFAGESRNRGMLAAKGRYVLFLDSDDYIIPGALEPLYRFAVTNDLDWVKTTAEGIDDTSGSEKKIPNARYSMEKLDPGYDGKLLDFKNHPNKFLETMAVVPWNAIYKRSFLLEKKLRFNNLFCVNDRSFFVDSCVKGERMMVTRIPIVRHRTNVSGSLVAKRVNHFDCQFGSYKIVKQICEENHVSELEKFEILEHEIYDIFMWYRNFVKAGTATEQTTEDLKKFLQEEVDIPYYESYGKKSRWLKYYKELV
ncbi:MAG: glycosyltransferase family 2 protein [Eubacteriales bacterium]|nr:glycosyltransferase family 2 protein [Eubacteriales bacterium]